MLGVLKTTPYSEQDGVTITYSLKIRGWWIFLYTDIKLMDSKKMKRGRDRQASLKCNPFCKTKKKKITHTEFLGDFQIGSRNQCFVFTCCSWMNEILICAEQRHLKITGSRWSISKTMSGMPAQHLKASRRCKMNIKSLHAICLHRCFTIDFKH